MKDEELHSYIEVCQVSTIGWRKWEHIVAMWSRSTQFRREFLGLLTYCVFKTCKVRGSISRDELKGLLYAMNTEEMSTCMPFQRVKGEMRLSLALCSTICSFCWICDMLIILEWLDSLCMWQISFLLNFFFNFSLVNVTSNSN